MPNRSLPVRPDLEQLKHQAKDLLRAIHAGDPAAIADFASFIREPSTPPTPSSPTRSSCSREATMHPAGRTSCNHAT